MHVGTDNDPNPHTYGAACRNRTSHSNPYANSDTEPHLYGHTCSYVHTDGPANSYLYADANSDAGPHTYVYTDGDANSDAQPYPYGHTN